MHPWHWLAISLSKPDSVVVHANSLNKTGSLQVAIFPGSLPDPCIALEKMT